MQFKSGHCGTCNGVRKIEREKCNHILHLLISIFTFGCWIPVWLLTAIKIGGWRCSTCGSSRVKGIR